MRTKTRDRLNILKIMRELKEYEESSARGGTRITVPVEQAVKMLAKHKPEPKKSKRATANNRT